MEEFIAVVFSFLTPCVNFTVMLITLPRRWKLRYALAVFAAALLLIRFPIATLLEYLGASGSVLTISMGLLCLPVLLILIRGQIFQIIFAFFMQTVLSGFLLRLVGGMAQIFYPSGGNARELFIVIGQLVMYAGYVTLMYIYGRRLFEKLFVDGKTAAWGLYSMGAALSFILLIISSAIEQPLIYFSTLFFAVWSFAVLCFAIINTNETAKQRYEAEFARNVVSSGRDHYQKMDEMYDKLRTLRHDTKYHLNAARKMLSTGGADEAGQYLTEVENQLAGHEMRSYCPNTVINALIAGYAERCGGLNIEFEVDISILKAVQIPNYEMCVIIGNLLENAVEACEKLAHGRVIELAAQSTDSQLLIMVKNSFDGAICQCNGKPVSRKINGGFGLRSVKEVITRYSGDLTTEWDTDIFTAYVAVRL